MICCRVAQSETCAHGGLTNYARLSSCLAIFASLLTQEILLLAPPGRSAWTSRLDRAGLPLATRQWPSIPWLRRASSRRLITDGKPPPALLRTSRANTRHWRSLLFNRDANTQTFRPQEHSIIALSSDGLGPPSGEGGMTPQNCERKTAAT